MIINSFAKINIGLQVLNKREDNFHNINTIFAKIDLKDTIEITESDKIEVIFSNGMILNDIENIVKIGAEKLSKRLHINKGAKIYIDKYIPMGGGLGGGSSNAAYTLLGLLKFWGYPDRINELKMIAPLLGSDVPYFIEKGFALGSSRGEKLEYFNSDFDCNILILNTGLKVNTGLAYKNLNRSSEHRKIIDFRTIFTKAIDNHSLFQEYFINDFESVIFQENPILKELKNEIYREGAFFASMSGSGSTLYGFFDSDINFEKVNRQFGDYTSYFCKFVKEE